MFGSSPNAGERAALHPEGGARTVVRLDLGVGAPASGAFNHGDDDVEWGASVVEAAAATLHGSLGIVLEVIEHDAKLTTLHRRVDILPAPRRVALEAARRTLEEMVSPGRLYSASRMVLTHAELAASGGERALAAVASWSGRAGAADALRLTICPVPGVVIVLATLHHRPIHLGARERRALLRLALQLETGYRMRHQPDAVAGRIDDRGWSGGMSPQAVWLALVEGRLTLVPTATAQGSEHVLVESAAGSRPFRVLTEQERDVVRLALRGTPTKSIGYELDVTPSAISKRLETAAQKMGVGTRSELLRIGSLLARQLVPAPQEPGIGGVSRLSSAEEDVLQLLRHGLTNEQIALQRARSVRTIANQVASILRKTRTTSRRALLLLAPK